MHQQERTRSRRNFAGGDAGDRGGRGTTWSAWVPGAAKRDPGRRTKVRTGTRRVGGASSARSKNTDVRGIVDRSRQAPRTTWGAGLRPAAKAAHSGSFSAQASRGPQGFGAQKSSRASVAARAASAAATSSSSQKTPSAKVS